MLKSILIYLKTHEVMEIFKNISNYIESGIN